MSDHPHSTMDELASDAPPGSAVAGLSRPWHKGIFIKVVRGVGWTFIYMGFLVLGFVGHQLYVTDFFADRAQTGLAEQLDDRLATSDPGRAILDPDTGEVIPIPGDGFDDPDTGEVIPIPGDGFDPTVGGGDSEFDEFGDFIFAYESAPELGEPVGTIRIPEIGLSWTVVEGVRLGSDLKKGAGHYPDTPLPGQPGNAALAGHRTTWGAPFHNLDQLGPGHQILWDSLTGTHIYEVRAVEVVEPSALWVLEDREGAWLTLTTCHPKFSARQRLVVFAEIVDGPNASIIVERI